MNIMKKRLGIIFLLGIIISIYLSKLSLNWFNIVVCIIIGYIFMSESINKFEDWFNEKTQKNIYERRVQKMTLELLNLFLLLIFFASFFINLYYPKDIILLLSIYSLTTLCIVKAIRYILIIIYNLKKD